eukprot:tig00000197_g15687.t1
MSRHGGGQPAPSPRPENVAPSPARVSPLALEPAATHRQLKDEVYTISNSERESGDASSRDASQASASVAQEAPRAGIPFDLQALEERVVKAQRQFTCGKCGYEFVTGQYTANEEFEGEGANRVLCSVYAAVCPSKLESKTLTRTGVRSKLKRCGARVERREVKHTGAGPALKRGILVSAFQRLGVRRSSAVGLDEAGKNALDSARSGPASARAPPSAALERDPEDDPYRFPHRPLRKRASVGAIVTRMLSFRLLSGRRQSAPAAVADPRLHAHGRGVAVGGASPRRASSRASSSASSLKGGEERSLLGRFKDSLASLLHGRSRVAPADAAAAAAAGGPRRPFSNPSALGVIREDA